MEATTLDNNVAQAPKEEIQTSVRLESDLHQRARLYAVVNKGSSLQQLINDGLRLHLDRLENKPASESAA